MSVLTLLFGSKKYKQVNQQQAIDLAEENKKLQIIDVRTPQEFKQGAIRGSISININDPAFVQKVNTLDKNGIYVVYCRSGVRSRKACSSMSDLGFKNVYNLKGGISRWRGEYKIK